MFSVWGLTLRPRIWLMAALSFNVHSAMTFALISFMYNMKAFRGFLMTGFLGSFCCLTSCGFLVGDKRRTHYSLDTKIRPGL